MELVTAVALFSIFATVVLVALNPLAQYQKALDSKRKNDLSQIVRGIELYYGDHGRYPPRSQNFEIGDDSGGSVVGVPWGNEWQPYMDLLPKDPVDSKKYIYEVSNDGQMFYIFAAMDRQGSYPDTCHPNQIVECDAAPISCSINGSPDPRYFCDYGLSSPNTTP